MAGIDNLKYFTKENAEKAREAGRKGGKASVAVRRNLKSFRQTLKELLACEIPKKSPLFSQAKLRMKALGLDGVPTVQHAFNVGVIQAALKGNIRAAEFVRDTIGEKPTESFEDRTPVSPFILGVIPPEKVAEVEAARAARQAEDERQ